MRGPTFSVVVRTRGILRLITPPVETLRSGVAQGWRHVMKAFIEPSSRLQYRPAINFPISVGKFSMGMVDSRGLDSTKMNVPRYEPYKFLVENGGNDERLAF